MFDRFSDNDKVWIYQSSRPFTEQEQASIQKELDSFVAQWTAHGTKLRAEAKVLSEYHLALAVEKEVPASGCSIDASVRFIKELGAHYQIDFFNRLQMLIEVESAKQILPFSQLAAHPEALVYDNRVSTVGEWRLQWKQAVKYYLATS